MIALALVGFVLLAIGFFLLWIARASRNERNLSSTVGTLIRTNKKEKIKTRFAYYNYLTYYTYSYSANGKIYTISGAEQQVPRSLARKVTIIYIKGFPRFAYLEKFTARKERAMAIIFLLGGVAFLLLCLLCFLLSI